MKWKYHADPDHRIRLLSMELAKIHKQSGKAAYQEAMRLACKHDPWFLMRVVLGFEWLDEELVGHKLIRHIAKHWGEDIAVLLPRGHGKTLPISAILIGAILQDPNLAILQLSRTDGNAAKIGKFIASHLMQNDLLQELFGRKYNPDGFLPASPIECSSWGVDGYTLPYRKVKRIDPTLLCIPMKGAKAGKHPDIVWIDDPIERENNHENGYAEVEEIIMGLWALVPAGGFYIWTGTRWADGDPLGMAIDGTLRGKKGPFRVIQESCYVDDDPSKGPSYPKKKRWKMAAETGYDMADLDVLRTNPKTTAFFNAQYRNDPAPADESSISTKDIIIYDDQKKPSLDPVFTFGIEIDGGGRLVYNGFREWCDELKIPIPLEEILMGKTSGVTKADKLIGRLQPVIAKGRLHCQAWMIGDPTRDRDTLGYELQRVRVSAHDDIANALYHAVGLLENTPPPPPGNPLPVAIAADCAYTAKQGSDYTVIMAVAKDAKENYWVIDYDRFRIERPTEMYGRMLKFYRKFDSIKESSRDKYASTWR